MSLSQILFSIVLSTVIAPAIAARHPDPRRGARRMLLSLLAFHAAYVAWVTLVHTRYGLPPPP